MKWEIDYWKREVFCCRLLFLISLRQDEARGKKQTFECRQQYPLLQGHLDKCNKDDRFENYSMTEHN